ncbi:MAG: SH3 domain-containing protein [Hyphomicrobiales bacterium]|nr:SH3 domain-containing protein [Hyphomicrobiales bacterium]
MRKFMIGSALATILSVPFAVAEELTYLHNGSSVVVAVDAGEGVTIRYLEPRIGLDEVGVRNGTELFNGRYGGDNYIEGMANIFDKSCGKIDYFVSGEFRPGKDFKLNGAAPVVDGKTCSIVDNTYEGDNANLVFKASADKPVKQDDVVGTLETYCVTGVSTTLNVRVGPGTDYQVIGELPAGMCNIVAPAWQARGNWAYLEEDTISGWVSYDYLRRQ